MYDVEQFNIGLIIAGAEIYMLRKKYWINYYGHC